MPCRHTTQLAYWLTFSPRAALAVTLTAGLRRQNPVSWQDRLEAISFRRLGEHTNGLGEFIPSKALPGDHSQGPLTQAP